MKQRVKKQARLDEFDKTEWRDVARRLRPDWTEADFEREWNAYFEWKQRRALN